MDVSLNMSELANELFSLPLATQKIWQCHRSVILDMFCFCSQTAAMMLLSIWHEVTVN